MSSLDETLGRQNVELGERAHLPHPEQPARGTGFEQRVDGRELRPAPIVESRVVALRLRPRHPEAPFVYRHRLRLAREGSEDELLDARTAGAVPRHPVSDFERSQPGAIGAALERRRRGDRRRDLGADLRVAVRLRELEHLVPERGELREAVASRLEAHDKALAVAIEERAIVERACQTLDLGEPIRTSGNEPGALRPGRCSFFHIRIPPMLERQGVARPRKGVRPRDRLPEKLAALDTILGQQGVQIEQAGVVGLAAQGEPDTPQPPPVPRLRTRRVARESARVHRRGERRVPPGSGREATAPHRARSPSRPRPESTDRAAPPRRAGRLRLPEGHRSPDCESARRRSPRGGSVRSVRVQFESLEVRVSWCRRICQPAPDSRTPRQSPLSPSPRLRVLPGMSASHPSGSKLRAAGALLAVSGAALRSFRV